MNYDLDYFLKEERNGVIFCKIGKSSKSVRGKGGYFPYREYIERKIELLDGRITFTRLDDIVKYLHYGDDLVIFSFIEGECELPLEGYIDNKLNEGCYDTRYIYVKEVLSFCDVSTVDYIYKYSKDRTNFVEYSSLAIGHLKDKNLFETARRWEKFLDDEKVSGNEVIREEGRKQTSFWKDIREWLRNKVSKY